MTIPLNPTQGQGNNIQLNLGLSHKSIQLFLGRDPFFERNNVLRYARKWK